MTGEADPAVAGWLVRAAEADALEGADVVRLRAEVAALATEYRVGDTIRLTETQRLIITCNIRGVVASSRRDTLAKLVRAGLVLPDTDGRGGVLTPAGKVVAEQATADPDRRTFRAGAPSAPASPRPPRLTEAQRAALATALAPLSGGRIIGHGRTVAVLVQLGLVEPVEGWYERSVSRRVGRLYATSSTWGVVGHRITDAGRRALAEGGEPRG